MYAREFPQNKSGTVRAFEDAYAKEEFLRRSAGQAESRTCTGKPVGEKPAEGTCAPGGSVSVCAPKPEDCRAPEEMPRGDQTPCAKPPSKECPLQKLFGISDGGDILLLLLIVFFLTDGDSENDKLIPLLLAVLLLLDRKSVV